MDNEAIAYIGIRRFCTAGVVLSQDFQEGIETLSDINGEQSP